MILADLLSSHKEWIVQYHEHDSLLENRPDEELNEEERKNAWEEYEREKQGLGTFHRTILPNMKTANMFGYINTGSVPVRPVNLMPSLSLPGSLAGTHGSVNNVPFITTCISSLSLSLYIYIYIYIYLCVCVCVCEIELDQACILLIFIVLSTCINITVGALVSGRNTHLNMQIAQLPMVVQEIIKYVRMSLQK